MTAYQRVRIPGPINTFGQDAAGGIGDPFFTLYTVTKEADSPYPTIQSAINAAKAQAAIDSLPKLVLVGPGTYVESLVYSTGGEEITVRGEADAALGGRDLKESSFVTSSIQGGVIIHGLEPIESECIQVTLTSTSDSTIRFENITFFKNQNTGRVAKIIGLPTGTHLVEFVDCRFVKKAVVAGNLRTVEVFSGGAGTTINFTGCYMLWQGASGEAATAAATVIKTSTTKNYNLNIIDCHVEARVDNATTALNAACIQIDSTSQFRPFVLIDGCEITNSEGLTGSTTASVGYGIHTVGSAKSGGMIITNNLFDVYGRGVSIDSAENVYTGSAITVSDNEIHYGRVNANSVQYGILIAGSAVLTVSMYRNLMNCYIPAGIWRLASDMIRNIAAVSTIVVQCAANRFLGAESPGTVPNTYQHNNAVPSAFLIDAIHGEPIKGAW